MDLHAKSFLLWKKKRPTSAHLFAFALPSGQLCAFFTCPSDEDASLPEKCFLHSSRLIPLCCGCSPPQHAAFIMLMCLCVCGCGPSKADTVDLNTMKLLMLVKWLHAGSHSGATSPRLSTRDFKFVEKSLQTSYSLISTRPTQNTACLLSSKALSFTLPKHKKVHKNFTVDVKAW